MKKGKLTKQERSIKNSLKRRLITAGRKSNGLGITTDEVADIAVRHILNECSLRVKIHSRDNIINIVSVAPIKLKTVRNGK